MKVLVVIGDCLQKNSSANLCHIAYIQGLIDLDYNVTVLSAEKDYIEIDKNICLPRTAEYIFYNGGTIYEKMSINKHKNNFETSTKELNISIKNDSIMKKLLILIKKLIKRCYGVYFTNIKFVRSATKYRNQEVYDYVISLSYPSSSHLLVNKLLSKHHIIANKWLQIWEDPWNHDIYSQNNSRKKLHEEKKLLRYAQYVCYVSPLTLNYQKQFFNEYSNKMFWEPLPYYYKDDSECTNKNIHFGYFGDFVPITRNIIPFYDAAKETNVEVDICGNPAELLVSTDKIKVHSRVPLETLKKFEQKTNVLVFICNKQGGQIPGKIYQYSATTKKILFILDGTKEEKEVLYNYFSKFNRFIFCENNIDSIKKAIQCICDNKIQNTTNKPLDFFSPKNIMKRILKDVDNIN